MRFINIMKFNIFQNLKKITNFKICNLDYQKYFYDNPDVLKLHKFSFRNFKTTHILKYLIF